VPAYVVARNSVIKAYLMEAEILRKLRPSTLMRSQEPQRGFHDIRFYQGCTLEQTVVASALDSCEDACSKSKVKPPDLGIKYKK